MPLPFWGVTRKLCVSLPLPSCWTVCAEISREIQSQVSFIALCHCHGIQIHNPFSSCLYKQFFHPKALRMVSYQFVDVKTQMQSSHLTAKKELWSRGDPRFLDHQVSI